MSRRSLPPRFTATLKAPKTQQESKSLKYSPKFSTFERYMTSLRQKLIKRTKHVVSIPRNSLRTKKDEISFERNGVFGRGNETEGKLKKRVNFKGKHLSEEIEERGQLRILDSSGKKKGVYAKEGRDKNGKLEKGVATSKKRTLFEKGEKKVKNGPVEGNTGHRTMWVPGKLRNLGSNGKRSTHTMKERKQNVVLATAKPKVDLRNGLVKRSREKKSELGKRKSNEVVSPTSFVNKKARDKMGLDHADAETLDERPKKKKRVIKLDPHDISNKRLDDGIGVNGGEEEKEKEESEKEPKMSKNAQFRAIQPSPSILSFVEKNLLGRRRTIDLRRAGYNIDLSAPLDNIPFSSNSEREKIEENVFRNKLEFFAAAKVSSSFPPPSLPEIAFAGRSNVGKSSLLNALTRQWGVVRTSEKPGLTQTINFFKMGTKLCLVDLPGYGFAYAKEEVKDSWEELVTSEVLYCSRGGSVPMLECLVFDLLSSTNTERLYQWGKKGALVKEYVSTRAGLKRVCLLIDTKWGMKPRDQELIELMERSKTKYQIVLTKTDVVFPIDVARRAMQIEESLLQNKSVVKPLMMVSSKSGAGIRSLRTVLANITRFAKRL
ncbi:hypothetical protein V8G54_031991 [Vigna mungo]|uniref:EngB-type G domain-containing protein n=2 Tax=Magnoliopsida TaxID=3398 RepID=A0AAQ3MLE8_VIGMU